MALVKRLRDRLGRALLGEASVPRGLYDLSEYFRVNGPIEFSYHHEDGTTVAVSKNFRQGSIMTEGKNTRELDVNIRDAILTMFDIPSSYEKEANLVQIGSKRAASYALA